MTVITPPGPQAGTLSDVASKPIFIAGEKGWRQAANNMKVQNVMLINAKGDIYVTRGMKKRLNFLEKNAVIRESD